MRAKSSNISIEDLPLDIFFYQFLFKRKALFSSNFCREIKDEQYAINSIFERQPINTNKTDKLAVVAQEKNLHF